MRTIEDTLASEKRLQSVGDPRTDEEVRDSFGFHVEELQAVEDAWRERTGKPLLLAQTECAFDSDLADVILGMRVVARDSLLLNGEDEEGWLQRVVDAMAILDPHGRATAERTVTVRIENAYADGHESQREVIFAAPTGDLEEWFDTVVYRETGDGHGVDGQGSCYVATIIAADDEQLVGAQNEWVD